MGVIWQTVLSVYVSMVGKPAVCKTNHIIIPEYDSCFQHSYKHLVINTIDFHISWSNMYDITCIITVATIYLFALCWTDERGPIAQSWGQCMSHLLSVIWNRTAVIYQEYTVYALENCIVIVLMLTHCPSEPQEQTSVKLVKMQRFWQEITFEDVVYKMSTTLSVPQYVNKISHRQ